MSTSLFDSDPFRKTRLFDSTVIREAQEGMECMANVLEASTAYSIIGKDLDGPAARSAVHTTQAV